MKEIMQHDKGYISISKHVIISTKPSDDVIKSIFESCDTNPISSLMVIDCTRMESIVNLGILASSSSKGK